MGILDCGDCGKTVATTYGTGEDWLCIDCLTKRGLRIEDLPGFTGFD